MNVSLVSPPNHSEELHGRHGWKRTGNGRTHSSDSPAKRAARRAQSPGSSPAAWSASLQTPSRGGRSAPALFLDYCS